MNKGQIKELVGEARLGIAISQIRESIKPYLEYSPSDKIVSELEEILILNSLKFGNLKKEQDLGEVAKDILSVLNKLPDKFWEFDKQIEHQPDLFDYSLVYVEGGTFMMGSNDGKINEKPPHSVTVNSFQIGKYPVTQAQWAKIMDGNNPSHFKGDENRPVESVTWNDIQTFIAKLKKETGKTYRLPTEAEWEFAASGGNKSKGYIYSGSNDLNKVAWFGDTNGNSHAVGTKEANELGIHDMSGNVWEWCEDLYKGYAESNYSSSRVYRGGGWFSYASNCRSANRSYGSPIFRYNFLGFRLVFVP